MKIRTLLILVLLVIALSPLAFVISLNLPRVLKQFDHAEMNRQLLVLQQEYLEARTELAWGQDTLRALSFSKGVVELVSNNGDSFPPDIIRRRVIEMVDGWYQNSISVIGLRLLSVNGIERLRMIRGSDGTLRVVANRTRCTEDFPEFLQLTTASPNHKVFNAGIRNDPAFPGSENEAVLHVGVAIRKDGFLVGVACLAVNLTPLVERHAGVLVEQGRPSEAIYSAPATQGLLAHFSGKGFDFGAVKPGLVEDDQGTLIRLMPVFIGDSSQNNIWLASNTIAGDTMVWVQKWRQHLFFLLCGLVAIIVVISIWVASSVEQFATELIRAFHDLLHYQRPMKFSKLRTIELRNLGEELSRLSCQYLESATAREKMRNETKRLESKLRQSQKMEAVGLLAGGVAHDLNNILSGMISYPQLLLLQLADDSPLRKSILAIQYSGERAAAVVDDLLTVARGVASEREVCDLNQLVRDYIDSPEYLKIMGTYLDVHCELYLAPDPLLISCSVVHIKKILTNLLNHGFESTRGNGSVSITSRSVRGDGDDQSWVELILQDSGDPISSEDVEHLFEPFYTKRKMGRGGTGLGLAVVWNTMGDHRGSVRVESDDTGTRFILHFPRPASATEASLADLAQIDLRGDGEHILVVDDEAQQRDIARQILEFYGYKVDAVASGEEAVAFCRKQQVDLLLLDMVMAPGINGRQTYEQIEQMYPGQKAIIVSGFSENDEVSKAHDRGARGFVKKPYTMEFLAQVVKEELSRS